MISVLFNLLRLVLWTRTWSVLVNVLCMLAESKYSTTLELVLNVYFNLLVGGGVEFFCILADYLYSSIRYWVRSVEVFNCNCEFLCVSFQFHYFFLLHIFCNCVVWSIQIQDFYIFLMYLTLFYIISLSALSILLSDDNIAICAFSWLLLCGISLSILLLSTNLYIWSEFLRDNIWSCHAFLIYLFICLRIPFWLNL